MTRLTRARLWVFLIVGGLAVVNAGARYAGLTDLVLPTSYHVQVHLRNSGGLFERAEVTWRGFTVGRVQAMEFEPDGVVATLAIGKKWQIPADLDAEVHNRSAVGEQYLDLVTHSDAGPLLREGSVIEMRDTSIPVSDQQFILAAHRLLTSVDPTALATVIEEAGTAFEGAGPEIARILDNAQTILAVARASLPATVRVMRSARVVLATQDAQAPLIAAYLADLRRVTGVLARHDADLRRVLADGTRAAEQVRQLAVQLSPSLDQLLGRWVTLTGLTSSRLAGLEETLVAVPWALASAQTPGRDGRAHFTFVGGAGGPQPCQLGYLPPSQWKSALDPVPSRLPDDIGCDEPPSSVPRGANSVHPER